jgi:CMP-N-acetylneuraminic acid synthetase
VIEGNRCVGVICARGGSKGLPGKNIRSLCGRPMIAWSIEAARESQFLDRVLVSTDDIEIAEAARAAGEPVPALRPAHLAGDDANIVDAVLHAIDTEAPQADYAVLLQATSPLRRAEDIDACIRLCIGKGVPAAASVTEAGKNPYWMFHLNPDGTVRLVIERDEVGFLRQALPQAWVANGAIYVAQVEWLRRERTFWRQGMTLAYPMPAERSVDVDTLLDFRWAEFLMRG